MIVVLGEIQIGSGSLDAALALSLEHVERSRREPGCISHDVHQHAEDPQRLVFVERWADQTALHAHFAVPESGAFVRSITDLAVGPPTMDVYDVVAPAGD